ncbi:metallophosphoesterase [Hydrogenobacter sp. T-2]|uniref:metallophosphoesterase n=1 Tax=Pampinifervens diazotrophicum TaxID=1632018 RepID=UPI002B25DA8A|nr:metallophosphoesterase [Hydrogenobacter sp. T-2]WPM32941.1 metallophosphoesterase [Hydrogenobacter sp. T-2]
MRWFILVFLTLFALMHLYAYSRVFKPALGKRGRWVIALLLSFGFFSPFIWRYADANMGPQAAYVTALSGLMWAGFLLYLVVVGLLFDLYRGMVYISRRFFGINPLPVPSSKTIALSILLLSTTLSAYSHYETLNLKVERYTLYTDKLPENIQRLKVLHISDIHLGPVMGMDKIRLVLEVYEREKPDLVVSTGDLVDGNMRNKLHLADALSEMKPPLGKYAVLGNHEYYRGLEQAIDFTQRAGFRLLRGDLAQIREVNLTVVGIDDDDCRFFKKCQGTLSDRELLEKANPNSFVLYLKHKPRLQEGAERLFDLMLSGHTHGGVYYPVGKLILTRLFISDRGFHRLEDSYIYISKGVGTGGPPMRLFSPPDVAVIEIVNRRR